jgi:outer membrane receptor protein involved in Fe transport
MKRTLLLFLLVFVSISVFAQTALKGKVTDPDGGDELPFATVQLFKEGAFVNGVTTDFEGNYYFSNIDPGTYDIQADFTGYQGIRLTGIVVTPGKTNVADIEMSNDGGVVLTEIVVREFRKPLIEQDNTTSGQTVTSEEIRNLPTRNINQIASITAGASSADEGGEINFRGSRANATNYYVDGVRVSATSIPDSEIEQLQVITGGVEARYGDVTGGIISITTKGPANRFSINAEAETSEGLDNYGQSLVGLAVNGPILKNAQGSSILGYRFSGRYSYSEDDTPSAIPAILAKDDVLAELEADPLRIVNSGNRLIEFNSADFITNDDVDFLNTRPFEASNLINLNGKIDARLSDAIDISFTGAYGRSENQFTPGNRRLLNAARNPTQNRQNYRGNVRFRHRLGGTGVADGGAGSSSIIRNASYTLQFTVENTSSDVADPIHGDNLFDYGHVGNFDIDYIPVFAFAEGRFDSLFHSDYREVIRSFDPSTSRNPTLSNYNNILGIGGDQELTLGDFGIQGVSSASTFFDFRENEIVPINIDRFYTINGRTNNQYVNTWFDTNVGAVFNTFNKGSNDLYTFQANASFEIVPGSSDKSRHSIQLGVIYEQRTDRGYGVAPRGLWNAARNRVNQHLVTVDENNRVIGSQVIPVATPGGVVEREFNVLAPTIQDNDGQFFRAIRESLGVPLDQFVNIDGLDPSQLSLDMFSARELTFDNLVGYSGYDYLGNEYDGTFDDFFTIGEDGRRSFNVAPFRPIYAAAYLQDKFTINKMIFRVGVRVDRFDANTRVLKDPFSLYEILGADDFHANFGGEKPGNIGGDYKVYTDVNDGVNVVAYRRGEDWFRPDGAPTNSPLEIDALRGLLPTPKYANPAVHETSDFIKSDAFSVDDSFKDYEVQFNVMPRLAFSFPISKDANFFAHYDVLLQRPPSNSYATPLDYFFFNDRNSGTFNNPALRPERTVDYEVGFKTRLSQASALTITAYYKEMRDMIQLRTYLPVPTVSSYTTFDNQDFGTVKGFSLTYDLRRTANFTVNANYTLQFADGTGSSQQSQRGLSNRGNLRTLFPLDFDERHRVNLVLDYRVGRNTNLPGIFKDMGANLQASAVSGRPYTANSIPTQFGGSNTEGAINGARQPFNFTLNGQINKDIKIGANSRMNVYFRVSNILDRRNILNVYSVTGSAEDPGYLQSVFGRDEIENIESGSRSVDGFLASYQWNVLNPGFFTLPRRMFLGAQFSL